MPFEHAVEPVEEPAERPLSGGRMPFERQSKSPLSVPSQAEGNKAMLEEMAKDPRRATPSRNPVCKAAAAFSNGLGLEGLGLGLFRVRVSSRLAGGAVQGVRV